MCHGLPAFMRMVGEKGGKDFILAENLIQTFKCTVFVSYSQLFFLFPWQKKYLSRDKLVSLFYSISLIQR